jgi:glucose-1-phosphate thymidylyltransferase
MTTSRKNGPERVGVIPAAGSGTRVSPLPCSKEIFPVGFQEISQNGGIRPKAAAQYLIENMRLAGIETVYFVLGKNKLDIPAYFGDGSIVGVPIGYLVTNRTVGVPDTLDTAYPFILGKLVLFGFPDIIFYPENAFLQLADKQKASTSDIVLGLFPAKNPKKMDMVELDPSGGIKSITVKPTETDLKYAWINAVWAHSFTEYMHAAMRDHRERSSSSDTSSAGNESSEIHIGEVIQSAISSGMTVDYVIFEQGRCLDIGTPEDLRHAVRSFSI